MGKTILFGEPMALLIADTTGPLEEVEHFTRAMSGAEVNVSIGLSRLGHPVEYLTRLGDDPFGHYIASALKKNEIGTSLVTYDDVYRTGIQLKNRVTDGSDPYAPYYRKGSAASHITISEIDDRCRTGSCDWNSTGTFAKCKKSNFSLDGQSKGSWNIYYI